MLISIAVSVSFVFRSQRFLTLKIYQMNLEKMNLKKLEKATKIVSKIKTIDSQLQQIEKLALQVVNNEVKIEQVLKITKLKQEEEETKAPESQEEAVKMIFSKLMSNRPIFSDGVMIMRSEAPDNNKTENFHNNISNKLALQILAVFIEERNAERKKLVNQFNKLDMSDIKL